MIEFYNGDILSDEEIEKLNRKIDSVIKEKEEMDIDYNLLKEAVKSLISNRKLIKSPEEIIGKNLTKEEMIKVMLDFFKFVDEDFYNKAINVILQQNSRIKMNIYNRNKVKNFREEDEDGLYKYTIDGSVSSRYGKSRIHIPTDNDNYFTIDDLYTLVHEISHLFDMNDNFTVPTKEEIENKEEIVYKNIETRNLLAETTAISFEHMLTDYLLKNTSYSKTEIEQAAIIRIRSSFFDAENVYAKLFLAEEKEKNGEITREWIKNTIYDNRFNPGYMRNIAMSIINNPRTMQWQKRYAIAGLIAPTIAKRYIEDNKKGVESIKRYIECIKNNDFNGALDVYDIELNSEGLKKLAKVVKEDEDLYR